MTAGRILREELRLMRRSRVAVAGFCLLSLLVLVAAVTSYGHANETVKFRERQQAAAAEAFAAQPDRHPHRVVHYGHFVYRTLSPLAAFDLGVDPFTGSSMFIEGHRQNTANFGDVLQGSVLTRFGQLTPAQVLQAIAPLLLLFLGYGVVARERDAGTLRVLLSQGATGTQLVTGKLGALLVVAALVLLPAVILLLAIVAQAPGNAAPAGLLITGYGLYLGLWSVLVVAVSALAPRARDALLLLLALWAVTVVLVPRIAPDVASVREPLTTRLADDVRIGADLRHLGDSHDPDDPHFATFRQALLHRHGVERIEDLPQNYNGLVAVEGERLTSGLFDAYASRRIQAQARQAATVGLFTVASPMIALRQLSMTASASDRIAHEAFLAQAEAYRFRMVQQLNQLQADSVSYVDDTAKDPGADRRKRVAAEHWREIPEFHHVPEPSEVLVTRALPSIAPLLGWLLLAGGGLWFATRRLEVRR